MHKIIGAISEYPWAITEKSLETIISIANRTNDIDAVRAKMGEPLNNNRKTAIRDGVAIIPIIGPIFRRANLLTEISGATSVQSLAEDFNQALANPEVKGILFDVDSPGGQANGISEFSQMIFNARSIKPIKTYAGGSFASAAYWIGSATGEVIINSTGIAGSIGAMLSIENNSAQKEAAGIRTTTIVSSVSPNKNSNKELQMLVDALGTIFVEDVAKNRGVTTEYVLNNFGKGGLFVGKDAVNAGLADALGTFEETLMSFQASKTNFDGGLSTKQKQIDLLKIQE